MFSYQFHIRDYLTKTRHLSLLEDLAYRRLIDAYYTEESPLPADIQACARLIAMREHATEVEAVLREFFLLTDDGWRNERCDQEIAKFRGFKEAGLRGSAVRWGVKDSPPIAPLPEGYKPSDSPPTRGLIATNNQKPDNQKPRTKKQQQAATGVGFDWSAGDWTGIDEARKQRWRDTHGVEDVDTELKKAALWVLDNPDKPRERYAQFLTNWMSKAAESRTVPAAPRSTTESVFEGLA